MDTVKVALYSRGVTERLRDNAETIGKSAEPWPVHMKIIRNDAGMVSLFLLGRSLSLGGSLRGVCLCGHYMIWVRVWGAITWCGCVGGG